MTVKLCVEGLPIPWAFRSPQILLIASLGLKPSIVGRILDSYTLSPIGGISKIRNILPGSRPFCPQHTAWRSSIEYYIICCFLFFSTTWWTPRWGFLLQGILYRFHSDWDTNPFGIFDDDAHDFIWWEHDSCTPLWSFPYQSIQGCWC